MIEAPAKPGPHRFSGGQTTDGAQSAGADAEARLVVCNGVIQSACGKSDDSGPFYCRGDDDALSTGRASSGLPGWRTGALGGFKERIQR
jgi:hypothetical protein